MTIPAHGIRTIQIPRRFVASEWGGTETTILNSSRALLADGHPTRIYTSLALADSSDENIQGVPVKRFPYCYPFLGLSHDDRREMDKKGGNLFSLSLLWSLLREPGVDLLHAHAGKRLGGIVRTAARQLGIPYVITLHGGYFDIPESQMQQMLTPIRHTFEWGKPLGALLGSRRVLEDAAAIVCVGENECRAARAALPGQRVELMPNGVDSKFFAAGNGEQFRHRFGIPAARRIILCVSRIDYQKNQLALIDALPSILQRHPDTQLVLVGPVTIEDYHKKILQRISSLGLKNHVSIIPGLTVNDPLLRGAYHAADVFCLPSLHEPFGIVVLEAWAAGLPVVAAEVGGIPSFTRHGKDVLHATPDQPQSLARQLLCILDNPAFAGQLAASGRRRARKEYDWRVINQRLVALYQDLTGKRRSV
ncbi:MAG: glycosyltransferase family 4 protein [Gammaproteobacteria bacterium]|nr:glycosyltransferase family 4 protein [Gammaproteobacteria bacterium]